MEKKARISDGRRQLSLFDEEQGLVSRSLVAAVLEIADREGGALSSGEARRELVENGLLPSGARGSNRLHSLLSTSGYFRHVGHGRYRLVSEATSRSDLTAAQEGLLRRLRGKS